MWLLSALVCACGFWKPVEFLGSGQEKMGGGMCADLILLSSGTAAFLGFFLFLSCLPLCRLHLPFVYFKVRKRGERMVGESHIFSSLRVLLCSPPTASWKALLSCSEIYRPSPPLDAVCPPSSFWGKRLSLSSRLKIISPPPSSRGWWKTYEGSAKRAVIIRWEGSSERPKTRVMVLFNASRAVRDTAQSLDTGL